MKFVYLYLRFGNHVRVCDGVGAFSAESGKDVFQVETSDGGKSGFGVGVVGRFVFDEQPEFLESVVFLDAPNAN